MSAFPLVAKHQLEQQNLKMAMAAKGTNRHYQWTRIMYRHWISTAQHCRFPVDEMTAITDDILERMDDVIMEVTGELPPSFPEEVSESIFLGMRNARNRLVRSRNG